MFKCLGYNCAGFKNQTLCCGTTFLNKNDQTKNSSYHQKRHVFCLGQTGLVLVGQRESSPTPPSSPPPLGYALVFIKVLQHYVKACFQRCFEFFNKRKTEKEFYKKSVEQLKKTSAKNVFIKKASYKAFQVYVSIVYDMIFWNLALALVLVLHCYSGDSVKYGLLSKHLFQRKRHYSS